VIIFSSDGTGRGFVLPTSVTKMEYSDRGRVTLHTEDGETVVTAVYVEKLGLVLHYNAHTTKLEMAQKKTMPGPKVDSYSAAK